MWGRGVIEQAGLENARSDLFVGLGQVDLAHQSPALVGTGA